MKNKTCGECKHLNRELAFCRACGAKWLKDTDGANCKYFEKITKPTNGDKLRQMSDEELAKNQCTCKHCIYQYDNCLDKDRIDCYKGKLAWLKQEAKDE